MKIGGKPSGPPLDLALSLRIARLTNTEENMTLQLFRFDYNQHIVNVARPTTCVLFTLAPLPPWTILPAACM